MSTFKASKILVFGATGQIGVFITAALLDASPSFDQITIFTSPTTVERKADLLDGWKKKGLKVIAGDVDDTEQIKAAYKDADTVISALGRNVIEKQIDLIKLAEETDSVKWFFPSEYGTDIEYGPKSPNEKPHQAKLKVRKYIRENVQRLKYTYLVTGPYVDMFLTLPSIAQEAGGFDTAARKAVLIEDGEGKTGLITMKDVGTTLVASLRHPEASFNRALKVQSFVATGKEIVAEYEKQTGEKWEIVYSSLETLKKAEEKAWAEGIPYATIFTLRRIWAEGGTLYDKTDNERIGLGPNDVESLEIAVKRSLALAASSVVRQHGSFGSSTVHARCQPILACLNFCLDFGPPAVRLPPSVSLLQAELNAPQDVLTCRKKSIAAKGVKLTWVHSKAPDPEPWLPECIPMSDAVFATVSSIFTVGGLLGALCAGPLSSKRGRRPAMRVTSILYIIGAIIETLAGGAAALAIGRFVTGMAAGASTVIVPLYISEIAPPKERGLFGAMTQVSINVGILAVQTLGFFLSYGKAWRWILAAGVFIALAQASGLMLIPESPAWLAANGDVPKARRTLQRIRGKDFDIREEVESWDGEVNAEQEGLLAQSDDVPPVSPGLPKHTAPVHLGFFDVIKDPLHRPAIAAIIGIMFAQQLCGINSVIMYSVSLLNDLLPVSSALLTILISVINLITTAACSPLPDKLGRKTCILISIIGQGISSLVLALSIQFGVKILSAVSVVSFVAFFAVGLGPVPFILASEMVGQEAVGAVQSWSLGSNYLATFLVAQFFPIVNNAFNNWLGGAGWVYFLFAGFAALFALFVSVKVPETKGKKDADEVWGRTRRLD
ncbi:hypothetical protein CNYM01_04764 [Colletotrichum nymphaeae SA-01]|uniref:Major facilitator superfamily (MFS) profile domain-containing protein n=1 Tax=Colletotrichum nymphaeae SA-01 TaxID=1460502 RepID=A0A135T583_9PEZI|nr:hypothetical protein CNYM01_04764 [Colletotrichum nymphaeae SA-01]